MSSKNLVPLIIFLIYFSNAKAYIEYDGWINVELLHALNVDDQESFTHRGNISIPSLSSGLSNVVQDQLSNAELSNLKAIASKNGFYRLRAVVEYPNGVKRVFSTANKACSLLNVQLNDELWIAIDGNGYVNAVTLSTSNAEVNNCSDLLALVTKEFNTDVLIRHSELAPIPDTASFIQKIEREREARDRGEVKDNRGFFAKYWIYIVPVVILIFVSGAANPDQQK